MKCMLPQPDVETNVADGGVIFAIGSSREHETNFRKNKVLHYELIYPSCGALKTSEWYLAISTCQTNFHPQAAKTATPRSFVRVTNVELN